MRSQPPPSAGGGTREAEYLFRTKTIPEIRGIQAETRRQIKVKEEELRLLVGESYRDLIDSADSILEIRSTSESIVSNLDAVDADLRSLSVPATPNFPALRPDPARARLYGIACRLKYIIDTPENIWGCLDESMLLEASGRYLRAKVVRGILAAAADKEVLAKFPVLHRQWKIVEDLKIQISQRSRERLTDQGLAVAAYADSLAAAATIDDLDPEQVLGLFLDSRKSWISQKLAGRSADPGSSSSLLRDVVMTVRSSLGQVGQLFLLALNEMPLFYKMVLGSPPGTQLFGAVPHPEEEVKQWKSHREKLEAAMVMLAPDFIAHTCSSWLRNCCDEIFSLLPNGRRITDSIASGEGLAATEKLVREALDGREGLEESLEQWLKSVFGSDIESPWNQICGVILKDGKDILEDTLEEAFVRRMKEIVNSEFVNLSGDINFTNSTHAIVATTYPNNLDDFQAYLKKPSIGGGIWFSEPIQKKTGQLYALKPTIYENDFHNSLNAYLGPEVSRIRDALDNKCWSILENLIFFVESHNSISRLKELAPFLQEKCYGTISALLKELEDELEQLSVSLENNKIDKDSLPRPVLVERSLFIGRLLFALRNHSSHIPLILSSPRQWVKDSTGTISTSMPPSPFPGQSKLVDSPVSPRRPTFDSPKSPRRQILDNPRRQTIAAAAALFTLDDNTSTKLDELNKSLRELCIKAHNLWIHWISHELMLVLAKDLKRDDALSSSTPLQGWEVTIIKQEESKEGSLEMTISLPSMPSLYITSFLFQACLEIHKIGGHVLDRFTLQMFAWELLEKVVETYDKFLSAVENSECQVSEKGLLQILLDLKFISDFLSGGKNSINPESDAKEDSSRIVALRSASRWKKPQSQPDSANVENVKGLIKSFSQRMDPIDWATYEPYLWENEKQSYKRYSVLFGFLVQLNRLYTDTVQKLPTKSNTGSNIMRCSTVPRFKYLPISAPALSSRGVLKSALQTADDSTLRSPWKAYSNGDQSTQPEFGDSTNFGVAAPLFKSIMTQGIQHLCYIISNLNNMLMLFDAGELGRSDIKLRLLVYLDFYTRCEEHRSELHDNRPYLVGSKFGESTSRWGSMLTDAQVGRLKDRSATAMSTFGDILPGPAAGFFSSLTSGSAMFDS